MTCNKKAALLSQGGRLPRRAIACECFFLCAERLAGRDRLHYNDYPWSSLVVKRPVAGKLKGRHMANLTLGLDVGCTSIGWSLIDEEGGRILAAGVRVFPEGVDRDQQGGEKSKSQSRRDARGMRRQLARRARRRRHLRETLASIGLFPGDADDLKCLMASCGPKKQSRCELRHVKGRCLANDAYDLRRKALTEKLEPFEIGASSSTWPSAADTSPIARRTSRRPTTRKGCLPK